MSSFFILNFKQLLHVDDIIDFEDFVIYDKCQVLEWRTAWYNLMFMRKQREKFGYILDGHVGNSKRYNVETDFIHELHDDYSLPIQQPRLHEPQQVLSILGANKIRMRIYLPYLLGYIEQLQLSVGEDVDILGVPVELREVTSTLDLHILEQMQNNGDRLQHSDLHGTIVVQDTDLVPTTQRIPQYILRVYTGSSFVLGNGWINNVDMCLGQEYEPVPAACK